MPIIYNLYNYIRTFVRIFDTYSMLLTVAIIGITMMIGLYVCDQAMSQALQNATLNSTILLGQP